MSDYSLVVFNDRSNRVSQELLRTARETFGGGARYAQLITPTGIRPGIVVLYLGRQVFLVLINGIWYHCDEPDYRVCCDEPPITSVPSFYSHMGWHYSV